MTAGELIEKMNNDPEVQERRRREFDLEAEQSRILAEAEVPILKDLAKAGYLVSSVWDLRERDFLSQEAIELLVHHLHKKYPTLVLRGLALALVRPEACSHWREIRQLYVSAEEEFLVKQGLALALSAAANEVCEADMFELIDDTNNGDSRSLLLPGLMRLPRGRSKLELLSKDPVFGKSARLILRTKE